MQRIAVKQARVDPASVRQEGFTMPGEKLPDDDDLMQPCAIHD